ncbi:hypothetical protein V1512DRAFT_270621 [Lipomyces arxii]|uniref:uncharacterized protein n=1 Tax=Lipomyces arxii TaxID=56418 RepID=UPI0034CF0D30
MAQQRQQDDFEDEQYSFMPGYLYYDNNIQQQIQPMQPVMFMPQPVYMDMPYQMQNLDRTNLPMLPLQEQLEQEPEHLVRRAHSDVTEWSSKRSAESKEESSKKRPGRQSVADEVKEKQECAICKKKFKKLEDHLWTHSPKPKPHKCRAGYTDGKATCQYVNMGFARVADRNRHELKHYDGRFVCPFGVNNCRIGNERFGRLDTFKRHLKTVHGHVYGSGQTHGLKRRSRTRRLSSSNESLECDNCRHEYHGVDAFVAHLNDCTYTLMHPGESAQLGNEHESE